MNPASGQEPVCPRDSCAECAAQRGASHTVSFLLCAEDGVEQLRWEGPVFRPPSSGGLKHI